MIYHGFFLLSFFFCCLISELAEQNSTKIVHVLGSNCNLKNACPKSGQIGGSKTNFFGRVCSLTATLKAYIFRTKKRDIDNPSSGLTTTRGLLYLPKMSWTLVHKRLQTGPPFLPTYVNSVFSVIARLHRQRSANRTQLNFAKRRMVNRANTVL